MRVMVLVPGDKDTEAGVMPSPELVEKMTRYNEALVAAGIMLAGDGLYPTAKAKRVRFDGDKRTVIDGPFAESKELIAGYWVWQVKSMEEAVQWLERAPFDGGTEVTLRPIMMLDDVMELPSELAERDAKLRAEVERKRS